MWGKRPASDLNCSSSEVIDVDDSEDIPYSKHYLVATSTKSRAYQWPPKATQSPKTMSIWIFSWYWRRFLMVFPLGVPAIISKEPIVDRGIPEFRSCWTHRCWTA